MADNRRVTFECAVCSRLAYFADVEAADLAQSLGAQRCEVFDLDGTQGLIVTFPEYFIIAFRGTTFEDIRRNLHVRRVPGPSGLVHAGFLDYTGAALGHVVARLKAMDPGKPVYLTGHSLGGAAATLAAAILIVGEKITNRIPQVITFGSPRVGNYAFTAYVDEVVDHQRWVNGNDGVAYIPWMLGTYAHCGKLHYITLAGDVWCDPNPIAVFLDRWHGFRGGWWRWASDKVRDHAISNYIAAITLQLGEESPCK